MVNDSQALRTTVVGSYPVPDWLKACPNEDTLTDAMALVLRTHERLGIDVICDGELSRWDLERNEPGGMVERFIRKMDGIQVGLTRSQRRVYEANTVTQYRSHAPGIVVDELSEGDLGLEKDWRKVRSLSDHPLKFTLTSPYMMARVVADEHYHNFEKLLFALSGILAVQVAHIDAEVLQIDEPNLPGKTEDSSLAAEAINRVLDAASHVKEKAVHLCFGNYGGQTIQQGHYKELIAFLNAIYCDHLVLETTRRPLDELELLKEVKPEIRLGLGVIDVKDLQVETPDRVAGRMETWANLFGVERLAFVHPDCGLQHLPREVADGKLRSLVQGRDLFLDGGSES